MKTFQYYPALLGLWNTWQFLWHWIRSTIFSCWIKGGSFPIKGQSLTCIYTCQNMCQDESKDLCGKLTNLPSLCHQSGGPWGLLPHQERLNKVGSVHSNPLHLGLPWAPAPRGSCWMAFAYWWHGLGSVTRLHWGRDGFPLICMDDSYIKHSAGLTKRKGL